MLSPSEIDRHRQGARTPDFSIVHEARRWIEESATECGLLGTDGSHQQGQKEHHNLGEHY